MSRQIRVDAHEYARLARRGLSEAEILAELSKPKVDAGPACTCGHRAQGHDCYPGCAAYTPKRTEKRAGGRIPRIIFNRIRKLFDSTHPLAPLRVVAWRKGKWEEI